MWKYSWWTILRLLYWRKVYNEIFSLQFHQCYRSLFVILARDIGGNRMQRVTYISPCRRTRLQCDFVLHPERTCIQQQPAIAHFTHVRISRRAGQIGLKPDDESVRLGIVPCRPFKVSRWQARGKAVGEDVIGRQTEKERRNLYFCSVN